MTADTVDRKILLAFIQGLISDDKEREKAVEYIQNMPSGQQNGANKVIKCDTNMEEQWQELKETIIEMRDNDGTGTQQEVCKFLVNLMEVLEKQNDTTTP